MKQKNGMPLAQAAAEDIIEMIRTNHMKPGDRLENEYELAKKLNVVQHWQQFMQIRTRLRRYPDRTGR